MSRQMQLMFGFKMRHVLGSKEARRDSGHRRALALVLSSNSSSYIPIYLALFVRVKNHAQLLLHRM